MNTLVALFLARLVICTAFPSSNSLVGGAGTSNNRHEIFRHEIAAGIAEKARFQTIRVPSGSSGNKQQQQQPVVDKITADTVNAEDTAAVSSKKIFADRFIHPSKLKNGSDKHGFVHVTVPATLEEDFSTKKAHHLHQPMPSKSKLYWAKATTPDEDRIMTQSTQTTQPPTTQTTTTTVKPSSATNNSGGGGGGGTQSWLVDDWEDDDEEDGGNLMDAKAAHQTSIIAPLFEAPPPTQPLPQTTTEPPMMAPLIPSVSYDIHDVKASSGSAFHVDDHGNVPHSYSIFDIPTGIATEIPSVKHHHQLHHVGTTLAPTLGTTKSHIMAPTTQYPLHRHHQAVESPSMEHQFVRPAIISKTNSFTFPSNNLKMLNLDGDSKHPDHNNNNDNMISSLPIFPSIEGDGGLLKPDNDISDHLGVEVLPTTRHFPSLLNSKHSPRIDEQPYFHSKTDYLEMPHAFPTPEYPRMMMMTTPELPVIDEMPPIEDDVPALEPILHAGPGGDTFVLKIPEEGSPGIIAADLVPVIAPSITGHRKFHEPVVKPEPAKPAHFQTTSAPYLRTDSPFRLPVTDFDGGIMSHMSTTPPMAIVDDGDTAVGWSPWTLKVGCSRTCGMGVEIYERFCQLPGGCGNRTTIRYKACAQFVCPAPDPMSPGAKDEDPTPHGAATYSTLAYSSRHRQCAKFNSQPFDGLLYEWTPYYTTTGQCELFCLAKSANFYHKFGEQVEDGTACDPYSESSICIKGKCHPVGCDGVVGSRLKRDRCGICGGSNDSCNTFDGLVLSGDFTLGYHDIIRLPVGATNIFIHEMAPSINNLALHLEGGEYVLNGDYHIGLSKKVFAGSVLFVYVHNDKQEESLFAEGPLTEPVIVAMLYQSDHVNIHYEYSLPKPGYQPRTPVYAHGPPNMAPSTPQPAPAPAFFPPSSTVPPTTTVPTTSTVAITYAWTAGEWSSCSVTCGTGNRLRVVTCIDSSSGNVVSDDLCPAVSRLETVENCRLDTCTVRWKVGNWSACSKTCGATSGVQRRSVECVEFASPEMQVVKSEFCERLGQPKPPSEQMCKSSTDKCPQWVASDWSPCQTICGDGNQTRIVTCSVQGNETLSCDNATKPAIWQKCQSRPCAFMVDWIVSAWSPCVDSCGGGVSTRKVRCATPRGQTQPSTFCRFKPRPSHLRKCQPNENLCRPRWTTGNWSNCSSICGTGVQTRSVVCVHLQQEVPYALEDEYCHEMRPESEQVCNGTECGYIWFIGPWTACSATCGTGHRTRTVLCLDGSGNQVELKHCPADTKPHHRQKCEGAIKHCSLKQQQEAAAASSGLSSVQQKAIQHPREDCSVEDYGCCPDGVTAASGPFNTGCPNGTCAESRFGCCPNSIVPAKGPAGEGCQLALAGLMGDCAETMFGCCPDGLTPAKGLDLRGCDGLCHDTRFGCCPDNIHPAAGVNFENCPGLNCSESQFGCCPDGVRPAPAADGKGCPNDGLEIVPTSASELATADHRSSVDDIVLKIEPQKIVTVEVPPIIIRTSAEILTKLTTSSTPAPSTSTMTTPSTTTTSTTTTRPTTTSTTTSTTTTPKPTTTTTSTTTTSTTTTTPTTTTTEEETQPPPEEDPDDEDEEESTTPFNLKISEYDSYDSATSRYQELVETTAQTISIKMLCVDSEFGCCPDGETAARGMNLEGCPNSGDCLTSTFGCCEDGVTTATGPDGEGCPENLIDEAQEVEDDEDVAVEPAESSGYESTTNEVKTEIISTRAMPDRDEEEDTTVPDSSLETGYITSGSGFWPPSELLTTVAENDRSVEEFSTTPEPPPTTPIETKTETVTRTPDYNTSCSGSRYGCCPDGKTLARGANYEGCYINCNVPYEPGECDTHELSWYYDSVHGVCARFWYSGCGGNTNRFATEEQCKAKCVNPLSGIERCSLPPVRGPCNRNAEKDWHFFDVNSMTCKPFEYGGCNGNNNRFESKKDCEEGCFEPVKRDLCLQPAHTGPCRASLRRWYFNQEGNRCEIFIYGGCNGNLNRFQTADACFSMCGGKKPVQRHHHGTLSPVDAIKALARSAKPSSQPRCREPKETGPCKAHMKRWFYDADTATCREFVYGGCNSNGNNFASVEECQRTCGGKPDETNDKKTPTTPIRAKHPACLLAADSGPCTDHVKRFYYDSSTLSCSGFWFGGCGGNQNNFPDVEHCESVCKPEEAAEVIYDLEEEMEEEEYDDEFEVTTKDDPSSKIIQESVGTNTVTSVVPYSEDDPLDCLEDFSYGECTGREDVWAFDQAAVACVRRVYSGCGGTPNRFHSHEACHRTCIQSQRGMTSTTKSPQVHSTTTTDFTGSGAYQEYQTSPPNDLISQTPDNCDLPQEPGTCSKSLLRFFYDSASDSCRPFFYTGCKGNANNFVNEAECLQACLRDQTGEKMKELREVEDCFQLPDQGPCDGQLLRWYFDFEHDRRCKTFYYGGCGGGKNNFLAHDDCAAFCSQAKCPSLARCGLASTPGACPYGLLVDANGCELCQCHDPCQRTKCATTEVCRVERQGGNFVPICESEPESDSCSESDYGCCPDGVTLSQRPDHSDCPEMPPEIITSGPTQVEAAVGETVTLLCRARGSPMPEIVWYHNWNHISHSPALADRFKELSDGTLQISNIMENDSANYTCRAHNSVDLDESDQEATTRTYQVIVLVPAKITTRSDPSIIAKLGSSILLPCAATGTPSPTVTWHFGDKLIKSDIPDVQQTPEGLKIGPVETRHIGTYKCTVENSKGQDHRTIKLEMEASLRIKILAHNMSYQVGSELSLTCEGTGFPRPRLRWQKNGGHLKHATIVEQISEVGAVARLTIDSVQVSDSGNYICIAANGHQEERQQTAIRVKLAEDELPANCIDKPQFANCGLIVAARLCGHQAFVKFCCESCFKAGQLRQKVLTQ